MTEKILNKRPNGMAALIGFSLLYIAAIAVTILCALPLDSESGNAGFFSGHSNRHHMAVHRLAALYGA